MTYGLTKQEREEISKLEQMLSYSNGILNKEKIADNEVEAIRLKYLYEKKRELILANLN